MISLDLEQRCLLELIKASLFGITPEIPENANWEKIFEAAKTQCIVPLLASSVPAEHREQWNAIAYQSKAHYMQMLYEQSALIQLLFDNDIPLIIFKGTAASIYYPTPSLRTFGDIDFYIPDDYFDSAINLLKENGYIFISNHLRQYEFEKNGIDLELHSKISSKHYKDVEGFYHNGFNHAVNYKIWNCSFPGLPTQENGLVLLGHIMQHLKSSGIGLRQIIDWMMFVHKELNDSVWEESFRSYAVEAGLEKLAVIVTYMCKKWLGLPDSITWCDNADEEVADQLLIRIMDDGNFGNERAPFENIKICIKNEGLFNHLQRSGFENWSLAQRFKIFKPIAWFYQICRYACQGLVGLFTGKKIFSKRKKNLSIEELWKRIE